MATINTELSTDPHETSRLQTCASNLQLGCLGRIELELRANLAAIPKRNEGCWKWSLTTPGPLSPFNIALELTNKA